MSADTTQASLRERIHDELIDSVEEELELEIDDDRLAALLEEGGASLRRGRSQDSISRNCFGCRRSS